MSLIEHLLPTNAATNQSLGHPAAGVIGWHDSSADVSGQSVTEQTALTFASVWCAVRILSETLASLPCILYRRTEGGKERATDDTRYALFHDDPNDEQSAFTFFETGTQHLTLWGNSYARIFSPGARIEKVETRLPNRVTVTRPDKDGELIYRNDDLGEIMLPEEMLHVAGMGFDGLMGYSVVQMARQSIGEGMAGAQHGAAFYGNGARPDGILKFPGQKLSKEARNAFRSDWKEQHGSAENDYNIAILHGGMDYMPVTMPHTDAQFLESRKFSVEEISRWFRVPPHMLYELSRSTNNNIEHQGLEFVIYSLAPWLRRWETTLNRKILLPGERGELFYEFLVDSLLRGDQEGRSKSYKAGREGGWLNVNEIRSKENMNPIPGGDTFLQPLNMEPIGTDRQEEASVPESLASEFRQGIAEMVRAVTARDEDLIVSLRSDRQEMKREMEQLGQLVRVAVRAEVNLISERSNVIKAAKAQVTRNESFLAWLDTYYDDDSERKRQLVEASDGDAGGFLERVTACLDNWAEE